jgi:hypothetical protein
MRSVRNTFVQCLAHPRRPAARRALARRSFGASGREYRDQLSATRRALAGLVTSLLLMTTSVTTRADEVEDVIHWNARVLSVLALSGQNNTIQTRSLAMAHAAIHDALNAIEQRYQPYAASWCAAPWASPQAATAAAAHRVLLGVIPTFGTPAQQAAAIEAANDAYAAAITAMPDGPARAEGIGVGEAAATAILVLRASDGALLADTPHVALTGPGFWQPTPNPNPPDPSNGGPGLAPPILPRWGDVAPFTLRRGDQFRPEGPAELSSRKYARDYNEVQGIGARLSTTRTVEQSEIARFWYEGSQVGWNRIARVVAEPRLLDLWDQARLFALLNFAMADGFIAGWNARYVYNFWRPVTAIRAGDADGNDSTVGDPHWETFLNTPAIPDYPSTHSVLGAAAAEVLGRFFHDDAIPFTTTSGAPFAGITRSYTSFLEAARENADSRVYAGIHFRTATRDGLRLGRKIGAVGVKRDLEPLEGRFR